MANLGKWSTPTLTTVLSPGAIVTNSMTAASSTISNHTNLDKYVDIEVVIAAAAFTAGAFVALYILESVDTTNFPAQSDTDLRLTTTQLLVAIPIGTTNAIQRVVARNVLLPVGDFQIKLDNQTGATFAASGNTVKFYTYDDNLNG